MLTCVNRIPISPKKPKFPLNRQLYHSYPLRSCQLYISINFQKFHFFSHFLVKTLSVYTYRRPFINSRKTKYGGFSNEKQNLSHRDCPNGNNRTCRICLRQRHNTPHLHPRSGSNLHNIPDLCLLRSCICLGPASFFYTNSPIQGSCI